MENTKTHCLHENGFIRQTNPSPKGQVEESDQGITVTFEGSHVCQSCGETKSETLTVSGPHKAERITREGHI